MLSLSLVSCSNQLGIDTNNQSRVLKLQNVTKDNTVLVNKIATKIREKRVAGFLAQIPAALYKIPAYPHANSAEEADISVGDKLEEFYEESEPVLTDIGNEEKGREQLELIDAVYSEQTADVVADKMGQIDPKMKENYVTNLENMVNSDSDLKAQSISQGIINPKTGKINLSKIKLVSSNDYSSDVANGAVSWKSIQVYYGICAFTLAGEVIWAFTPEWSGWNWMGWLKLIGLGQTILGIGLMYNHLSNEWGVKFGDYRVKDIVNHLGGISEAIRKVSAITISTAIPVGFAAVFLRGEINWLYKILKPFYNKKIKPLIDYFKRTEGDGINIIKIRW